MSRYGPEQYSAPAKRVSFPNRYLYEAPTNTNNGSNVDVAGGFNTSDSYKREPLMTSPNDSSKSDVQDTSDNRRDSRQYQSPYPSAATIPTNNTQNSTNATTYTTPITQPAGSSQITSAVHNPTNAPIQGYQQPNNSSSTPSYQSSTATINYQPTTVNPGYTQNASSNYQPNTSSTSQPTSNLSNSPKPSATTPQPPYPQTNPPLQQNQTSSPYQASSNPPSQYQSSYQQGYQSKPPPSQGPPPVREPSSTNMNVARAPPGSSLQRQQSSINTNQRPYQPSMSPTRPPAPVQTQKVPQTPRTTASAYAPSMQNYQQYQSSPISRPQSQTLTNYPSSRPSPQRTPASPDPDLFASNGSYSTSSSGLRSPNVGRWGPEAESSRPISASSYAPSFAIDKDSLPAYKDTLAAPLRTESKTSMQDKFKTLMRQNTQSDSTTPTSRAPSAQEVPLPRPLSRKNSEINVKLEKVGSGTFDNIGKNSIPQKAELLEDDGEEEPEEEDDDDFDGDKLPSEEGSPTFVSKTIKFFEQNDKARVPLTPKPATIEKKEKPVRPTHIDIVSSIVRSENAYEYESGVDESPVQHPNLRSISHPPKRVARIYSGSSARQWTTPRASYPGTPTRAVSTPSRTTPNTPKRNKPPLRFKPEEELVGYFRGSEYEHHSAGKENRPKTNGATMSPKKTPSKLPSSTRKTPTSTPLKSPSTAMSLPKTPESPAPTVPSIKKVPMNKIQVGSAPSPNIKQVKSKIGSLANTTHKPGGGNVKIESHKLNITAQSKIAAKNDAYVSTGGDKKIPHVKLQWNAKSKVGSLENASYKPGGGDKKIESVKLDFKDKAKPKVGSKDNVQHIPGGGDVKLGSITEQKAADIQHQKVDFKGQSKIGSLDNVKHRPGGGEVKIFDDKTYMKQIASSNSGNQSSKSNCDLTVVSEVRGLAVNDNNDVTDISIKKTTMIAASEPNMSKTTEVTVVTRSPSKERRANNKQQPPASHEVKLTYSAISSPAHPPNAPQSVEVVRVPAVEHAPILNPSAGDEDADKKPPLPSVLLSTSNRNGTAKEPVKQEPKISASSMSKPMKEPSPPKFEKTIKKDTEIKEEFKSIKRDEGIRQEPVKEQSLNKLLQNEAATHEKVGEIWKEVQKVDLPLNEPTNVKPISQATVKQSESIMRPPVPAQNQSLPQTQAVRPQQQTNSGPQQQSASPVQGGPTHHQVTSHQQRFAAPMQHQQSYNQPIRPAQPMQYSQQRPSIPVSPAASQSSSVMRPPANDSGRIQPAEPTVRAPTNRQDAPSYNQQPAYNTPPGYK